MEPVFPRLRLSIRLPPPSVGPTTNDLKTPPKKPCKKNVSFGSLEVLMIKMVHYTLSPISFTPKMARKRLKDRRHSI
jgi:hypothetical protein